MPNESLSMQVAQRAHSFLTRKAAPPPRDVVEEEAFGLEAAPMAELETTRQFVWFRPDHLRIALDLAERMMRVAAEQGGSDEGLAAAMRLAEAEAERIGVDFAKYATMVFLTHYEPARKIPIPRLEEREPEKVLGTGVSAVVDEGLEGLEQTVPVVETNLNYFREDALLNEHHDHWHIVYPWGGVSATGSEEDRKIRPRQGELFLYMHQQMLARYDAERASFGFPKVQPLSDYRAPIAETYDPRPPLSRFYTPRTTVVPMAADSGGYTVQHHEERRTRLEQAIADGKFKVGAQPVDGADVVADSDLLGCAIEGNINSPSMEMIPGEGPSLDPLSFYGHLHNFGHVLISEAVPGNNPGVMSDTATAIRDPVFYRWHRHIDDLSFAWQEKRFKDEPWDFKADAPPVSIGDSDVILVRTSDVAERWEPDFDWRDYGQALFGGDHWSEPASAPATDELRTYMTQRPFLYSDTGRQPPVVFNTTLTYLEQEEFVYFLRVANPGDERRVTVRIFIVPEEHANDRRMWIEMDKFRYALKADSKTVIFRPAWLASVIRKPGTKPPLYVPLRRRLGPEDVDSWCECGWPYNLLLPRGNEDGMKFRMLVMLTDWTVDTVDAERGCGSFSYCGARSSYPDMRPMGYPFDRPFAGDVQEVLGALDNAALRGFTIRHLGQEA